MGGEGTCGRGAGQRLSQQVGRAFCAARRGRDWTHWLGRGSGECAEATSWPWARVGGKKGEGRPAPPSESSLGDGERVVAAVEANEPSSDEVDGEAGVESIAVADEARGGSHVSLEGCAPARRLSETNTELLLVPPTLLYRATPIVDEIAISEPVRRRNRTRRTLSHSAFAQVRHRAS